MKVQKGQLKITPSFQLELLSRATEQDEKQMRRNLLGKMICSGHGMFEVLLGNVTVERDYSGSGLGSGQGKGVYGCEGRCQVKRTEVRALSNIALKGLVKRRARKETKFYVSISRLFHSPRERRQFSNPRLTSPLLCWIPFL